MVRVCLNRFGRHLSPVLHAVHDSLGVANRTRHELAESSCPCDGLLAERLAVPPPDVDQAFHSHIPAPEGFASERHHDEGADARLAQEAPLIGAEVVVPLQREPVVKIASRENRPTGPYAWLDRESEGARTGDTRHAPNNCSLGPRLANREPYRVC